MKISAKIPCTAASLAALVGLTLAGQILPRPTLWAQAPAARVEPNPATPPTGATEAQANSATYLLALGDMAKFRPGRPMGEILAEIHWAGIFEMATVDEGQSRTAIRFSILYKDENVTHDLWAISANDKFDRFVEAPWIDRLSIEVGNFDLLKRCAGQAPIDIQTYPQQLEATYVHRDFDPALTKIFAKIDTEFEPKYREFERKNAPLRDQFNAERLKLGMTRAEVAATFRAQPLDLGKLAADTFEVYGFNEILPVKDPLMMYNKTLAIYHADRLSGIYSGTVMSEGKLNFEALLKANPGLGAKQRARAQDPAPTAAAPASTTKPEATTQDSNSANDRIRLAELSLFRVGRPMTVILGEIHWRGNFELAGIVDGKPLTAVSYRLFLKDENFPHNLWAIFADNTFLQWVEVPEGPAWAIPVGSVEPLRQALGQRALVMTDYIKQLEAGYVHRPSDPGLTMIFLKVSAPYAKEFGEGRLVNERRRDQFNAARLRLGMTRAEVAATFRAAPLGSGTLPAGIYDIFGTTDFVPLNEDSLRCPLTLTLFRDEHLVAIYSGARARGDREGLERLRQRLPDIGTPRPAHAEPAPAGAR